MGILDSKICMQYWLLTFHIRGPQGEFPYQGTAGRVSISGSHRESLKLIQLYPFVLLWSVDGQLWAGDLKKLLKEMGGLE